MKAKCYFLNGRLINIGEWEEKRIPARIKPPRLGVQPAVIDKKTGNVLAPAREYVIEPGRVIPEVVQNPLPSGVVVGEREVLETDHGLILADDYATQRRNAYPDVREQLDAIWKFIAASGVVLPAETGVVAAAVEAVKSKYPKPEDV